LSVGLLRVLQDYRIELYSKTITDQDRAYACFRWRMYFSSQVSHNLLVILCQCGIWIVVMPLETFWEPRKCKKCRQCSFSLLLLDFCDRPRTLSIEFLNIFPLWPIAQSCISISLSKKSSCGLAYWGSLVKSHT
jgi:hypothetical protein